MINFFRKKRKKLADDNKPIKYMRFAFGEILLVVIGILIALSIDNWNEERKERKTELQYLKRLMIDLTNDTSYYAGRIAEAKFAIESLDKYIHETYETQESIEEVKQLFGLLYLNTDHLTTQNTTYQELVSGGKLSVFRNEQLKTSIVDYYRVNKELGTHIKEFNLASTEYLLESSRVVRNLLKLTYVKSNIFNDPKMFLHDEWEFINDPASEKFQAVESMAFVYLFRNQEHINYFYKLKSLSIELSTKINEELKKFRKS